MIYSRIVGTGSFLPATVVTNADLAARGLDTSDAWIRERTGIRERRIADKSQSSSDLALEASRQALQAADTRAADIDLIVVATSTPDYVFPSTACLLQAKLGVKGSAAFDVQAVCSGFVYGIATADKFIRSVPRIAVLIANDADRLWLDLVARVQMKRLFDAVQHTGATWRYACHSYPGNGRAGV